MCVSVGGWLSGWVYVCVSGCQCVGEGVRVVVCVSVCVVCVCGWVGRWICV